MEANIDDTFATTLTYAEFPRHYVYEKDKRRWKRRKKGFAISRISHVSPSSGELYYLRILLTQVRGPTSFDDIKTVDGIVYQSFKDACFARGLLDDDKEYISALREASSWASGWCLRRLFVMILLCSSLQWPDVVWEQTCSILSEDMFYVPITDNIFSGLHVSEAKKAHAALCDVDLMLHQNGKSLKDFLSIQFTPLDNSLDVTNHLIVQELSYDREALCVEAKRLVESLNSDQRHVYDSVMATLLEPIGGFFFVYGYGGTGKTFLWNALTSELRSRGDIVLTVTSSGIAARLLPSARTAHSRFAIPFQVTESSVCSINHNSMLANLIRKTKLIRWDEAPIVQRLCIEALDRSMKDIMNCNRPFGGKYMLMGGDFRQILPVIPKGTRASTVDACITLSYLWNACKVYRLRKNMRLECCSSAEGLERLERFAKWLLDIGDGKLGEENDGVFVIDVLSEILINAGEDPIAAIVEATYPCLAQNVESNSYFNDRAILAPTIEVVNNVNRHMCMMLPGDEHEYLSCDTVCKSCNDNDSFDDLYTTEFLNTIECSGMPPHRLSLKVGCPVMLLRNIDQSSGLCNGTRLRVTKWGMTVIEAVTLNGSKPNQKVLIHRMDMNPSKNRWPFKMQRRQFPIILSFAMTINKSQGQSLRNVRLFLPKPVFTHGQLCVALSRVRSVEGLKVVVGDRDGTFSTKTNNVVYREIFRNVGS